jgi:phosphotriesterase-related protein
MALEQLDLLESDGIDLGRVVIGHCDVFHPIATIVEVARRGAYVAVDTIGKERWRGIDGQIYEVPDSHRIRLIRELVEVGFSDQILLSSDLLVHRNELRLNPSTFGANGYGYILDGFADRLRTASIPESIILRMLVENPQRVLGADPMDAASHDCPSQA